MFIETHLKWKFWNSFICRHISLVYINIVVYIYEYLFKPSMGLKYWYWLKQCSLTHWGWVTHICIGNLTIIGSDNGLSPGRRQAIIWTNTGILLIEPIGTNFSEILIKIISFSFKKMHSKVSSGIRRPYCLGLNVLSKVWHKDVHENSIQLAFSAC